jgi:hypothetical protein
MRFPLTLLTEVVYCAAERSVAGLGKLPGLFCFCGREKKRLNAEIAEEMLSSLRFGGGVAG